MKNIINVILLLMLPAITNAEDSRRGRWYIGFGTGHAVSAEFKENGQNQSFDDWAVDNSSLPPLYFNFKVGATLAPNQLLGFDLTGVSQISNSDTFEDSSITAVNFFLVYTLFPQREGLFFRMGGGLSTLVRERSFLFSSDIEEEYDGTGYLLGVGYAFWLGRSFNLTMNLDYILQDLSGRVDQSESIAGYVGFDWY